VEKGRERKGRGTEEMNGREGLERKLEGEGSASIAPTSPILDLSDELLSVG